MARDIPSSGLSAYRSTFRQVASIQRSSLQLVIQSTYLPLIKALNNSISPHQPSEHSA
jgi:hypothetical protein